MPDSGAADGRRVLLTVSGVVPPELDVTIARGERPRADYRVMQTRLGADLVDADLARRGCGPVGRLVERIGGVGALLGWYCFRRRRQYDTILTDGEQVGIPLALLYRLSSGRRERSTRRRARHAMIVHVVSPPKKAALIRWSRLAPLIDTWFVYCTWQGEFVERELGVDRSRVIVTPFMVDTKFFAPDAPAVAGVERRRMICAVGLERRDYPTLMHAVDGLDVEVVVAAASPWSKQSDSTEGRPIPRNVRVARFTQAELRELYAASRFSVMPLIDVDFQAGITAILESMAMARPVICTRTLGQTDTIEDGVTGRYVPPGDAVALRAAIVALLDDPVETDRMGENARAWAVEHAEVDVYADRLALAVAGSTSPAATS